MLQRLGSRWPLVRIDSEESAQEGDELLVVAADTLLESRLLGLENLHASLAIALEQFEVLRKILGRIATLQ